MDDIAIILRSGLWRLQYRLSPEGRTRFFNEFLPLLHRSKAGALGNRDNSSWYLVYIGTKDEARGRGHAHRLVETVSRLADEEGRACYLESSNEVNLSIYRRLGFDFRTRTRLERAELPVCMDVMVREPEG